MLARNGQKNEDGIVGLSYHQLMLSGN